MGQTKCKQPVLSMCWRALTRRGFWGKESVGQASLIRLTSYASVLEIHNSHIFKDWNILSQETLFVFVSLPWMLWKTSIAVREISLADSVDF